MVPLKLYDGSHACGKPDAHPLRIYLASSLAAQSGWDDQSLLIGTLSMSAPTHCDGLTGPKFA